MSNLLLDDKPIMILPKLAKEIGLNEAIVLQQMHYWLQQKHNEKDGYYWVYNSYQKMVEKEFIFWSHSTVKRVIKSLEDKELLVSVEGVYNKTKGDKTKWYRIDYEKLKEITSHFETFDGKVKPSGQVDQSKSNGSGQVDQSPRVNMTKPIPEITSEITKKNNKPKTKVSEKVYDENSDEYKLTHFYIDRMKKMTDGIYEPTANLNKWYNEMRLMLDSTLKNVSDDRVERCKEAQEIILYATNDSFWLTNILSIPKLRKQANALQIKMRAKTRFNNNYNTSNQQQATQYEAVSINNLFGDA